jgi:mannose-6-phosphate isomerase-like protein (cupin superfamily)
MIHRPADMQTETRDRMRGGSGTVTIQHYFQKEDWRANARLCAKLTLPPGAGIGPHRHEQEDEVYIVLSGSGVLDDGTVTTRVSAGDAVLTGNGEAHAITNDGDEPLELIAVIMCYE